VLVQDGRNYIKLPLRDVTTPTIAFSFLQYLDVFGSLGEDETRWTGISLRDQGAEISSAQKFFECFGAQIP